MKPILFILNMPFSDIDNKMWFCSHCALIEGALMINSHWNDVVDVRRIDSKKPRKELVQVIGATDQWLPVLVLGKEKTIKDPILITEYLAETFGGAAPHP